MKKMFTVTKPEDFEAVIVYVLGLSNADNVVLALQGDLGAGKTTFTQQVAKLLGVTEWVNSPTFTIMKAYEIEHGRFDQLVHVDAYRIEDESEVVPLRLGEVFVLPRTIVCLEWPEQIPSVVPEEAIKISIASNPDESRQVIVSHVSGKSHK